MVKKNNIIIPFLFLVFLFVIFTKNDKLPIEELSIPAGLGVDTLKASDSLSIRSIPLCVYIYSDNDITSKVVTGKSLSIIGAREARALKQDKKFILGLEKVYILSEDYGKEGISEVIDVLFRNPEINDTSYMVICNGKAEDLLKLKVPQYPSSCDYIEGIIKNLTEQYFFSGDFQVINEYVRLDSPGRTIIMPYITIEEAKPKVTGMAYFKGDKLAGIIDMQESKYLNLLSSNGKKGIVTIKNSKNENIDFACSVKRKVTCTKSEKGCNFTIKLSLKGNIIADESKLKINEKSEDLALVQKEFAYIIKKGCEDFIKKMQEDYKVDLLELGRIAAAKYGRTNNYKDIIENSKIKVEVDVKIESQGRGDY